MGVAEWAGNLGDCIKLQTVSWNETSQNVAELQEMGRFLRRIFPAVFSAEFVQVGVADIVSRSTYLRHPR